MRRASLVLALLCFAAACSKPETGATDLTIDKATGRLGELDRVQSLAELPDGRVVFPQAGAILRADLSAGTADTIGRMGEGPGEYRQPYNVSLMHGGIAAIDGQLSRRSSWPSNRHHAGATARRRHSTVRPGRSVVPHRGGRDDGRAGGECVSDPPAVMRPPWRSAAGYSGAVA